MKVKRTIIVEAEVTMCGECPYYRPDKEASECDKLKEMGKSWEQRIIAPAWQEIIDPKCPLT